ncbi:hypothetical protein [Mycolicibacterium komossense]|uniref:DoxX family protein n=1 Tax=Mycolicibacterium komossense TaxID=1779 RepID=A0ABT3CLE8_9MYCO|nr:hypothetical protein [Mycolicibacterium komossense]MCV7230187.1 hypothetical protein [Mycolicibacterium komossense]
MTAAAATAVPTAKRNSRLVQIGGLVLAGTGLAHFAKPDLFEGITKQAFPRNTDQHIRINGSLETAIGLGLAVPKARKAAVIGAIGYVAYLGGNIVRNAT